LLRLVKTKISQFVDCPACLVHVEVAKTLQEALDLERDRNKVLLEQLYGIEDKAEDDREGELKPAISFSGWSGQKQRLILKAKKDREEYLKSVRQETE